MMLYETNAISIACPESRAEWLELGGGGGAVCYAPSRLGKLVLRVTGFPRVTQQCHVSQHPEESHHRETRHLYLGFHHPWDRDLWKSWIKEVKQLPLFFNTKSKDCVLKIDRYIRLRKISA